MLNVYNAPGVADSVDFDLHLFVKRENATGKNCPNSLFCFDEPCGCPYTRWMLCGMEAAADVGDKVKFISCFDATNIPYSSAWVSELANPMRVAKHCADALKLDWQAVHTCGGNISGKAEDVDNGNATEIIAQRGWDLAVEQSVFTHKLLEQTGAHKFQGVPAVSIDNASVELDNLEDMWSLTKAVCARGATASVCSAVNDAGSPGWDGVVAVV